VIMDTLAWAIKLTREPSFEGAPASAEYTRKHISGLAAYEAIATALERDELYPADNAEVLSFRCMALSNDGFGLLTDERRVADRYLRSIADQDLPGAEELRLAANEYAQESGILKHAGELTPKSWAPADELRKIADPALRSELAQQVRIAKEYEAQAVSHLERALEQLKAAA
jgi:hypothetical protein